MKLTEQLKRLSQPITLEERARGLNSKSKQLYVMIDKVNLQAKIGITDKVISKRLQRVQYDFRLAGMDDTGLFVLWNETLSFAYDKEQAIHKLLNRWRFGGGKGPHPTGGTEFFSLVEGNHLNRTMMDAIEAITNYPVEQICDLIGNSLVSLNERGVLEINGNYYQCLPPPPTPEQVAWRKAEEERLEKIKEENLKAFIYTPERKESIWKQMGIENPTPLWKRLLLGWGN